MTSIVRKTSTIVLQATVLVSMLLAAAMVYARFSGYELLSVQSDSMRPMMQKGDVVLLDKRDSNLKPGDVVSFMSPANPKLVITHRVIGVDNKRGIISTKGDNVSQVDTPVAAWNVQGTVKRVIPHLGFILNLLKHPVGLLVVIYLPAFGVILAELRRLNFFYATGIRANKAVHYRLHSKLS
jgi:signal peptidase I